MRISYEGLVYSLDNGLTPTKLKSGDYPRDVDTAALEKWMCGAGVSVAVQGDGVYYSGLLKIKSSPYLYYHQGDHDLLKKPLIAIVGPRKMTSLSRTVLGELFTHLKQYDVVTISGMAEGVDRLCHEMSIEHGIPTIAVLGAGIGHISKGRRRAQMEKIVASGGLVISEFPLGFKATKYSYPQRNRLVAGLAQAVFLPEAREQSGSLITVDFANVMGTPVYGIYDTGESSRGLVMEMQKGRVRPVVDYGLWLEEVLGDVCQSVTADVVDAPLLEGVQQSIYTYLMESGGQTIDGLVSGLEMSASNLLVELTIMEMEDIVRQGEGGVWIL